MKHKHEFFQSVCRLAIPVALQSMLQASFSIVDQIMIGQLGSVTVAGVGLAGKFASIFSVVVSAIGAVAGIMISQYLGQKSEREVHRSFWVNLLIALGLAGLFSVACGLFPEQVMGLYTVDPPTRQVAAGYLVIITATFLPMAGATLLSTLLRCMEKAQLPLYASIASAVLNTGLNYVLIFGKLGAPALGVTGAAAATLLSRIVEFLLVAVYALRDRRVPLRPRTLLRPGAAITRDFVKYASPVLVNETMWGLGVSVMTAIMGHMAVSAEILAAHAIMGNIEKFATVACFGVAGATSVMVGKRIGEGAPREEVYSLGCCLLQVSFLVGLTVSLCLAVLLPTVFRPVVFPLFHLEGLSLEIAATMCVVLICMLPSKAFDITNITGLLRAGGDARMASIIDLTCQWGIAVPLSFLTALVLDAPVAVVCFAIQSENFCKMPWGILRLRSRKWINNITKGPCAP